MRPNLLTGALALALLLAACGSPNPTTQASASAGDSAARAPATAASAATPPQGDPGQAMRDGLGNTLDAIAANAAGEVREVAGPLFDDFELDIAHAVVMDNSMGIGPSRTRILDLELLESDPEAAVAHLRERLEAAGFQLNSSENTGTRRDWDYRRIENTRNLQGVLVKLTERPLRRDRAPQHAGATARLGLTLSDSRQTQGR